MRPALDPVMASAMGQQLRAIEVRTAAFDGRVSSQSSFLGSDSVNICSKAR